MAQNSVSASRTETKRKRVTREANEVSSDDERQHKRQINQKSSSKSVYAQLPTPDDSSEDEDSRRMRNSWYQRRTMASLAKLRTGSMSSVRVNLDRYIDSDDEDDEVVAVSPYTPSLSLVSSISADERIPTPTTNISYNRRTWHPQLQKSTCLSPVIGEDCTLPSPLSPMTPEMMMEMDDASECLKGLSVYCAQPSQADRSPMSAQSHGRTARLHMGFRSDCDKCVRKVPGHNSHILWSS